MFAHLTSNFGNNTPPAGSDIINILPTFQGTCFDRVEDKQSKMSQVE